MRSPFTLATLVLVSIGAWVGACDNSARNDQIANVEKAPEKADEKEAAERKAKREAAEKAKADAEEARRVEVAKIAVVGEKKPKGLAEACEQVADARDRFIERLGSAEAKAAWAASRENERPMAIIECTTADSVEAAACQIAGLDGASPALAEHVDEILDYCVRKYARPKPGASGAASSAIPTRPK